MNRLKGKKAVVTGSASGIGKAIAKQFAREGAIDPGLFGGGANFSTEVSRLANEARKQNASDGSNTILTPGEDQYICEHFRRQNGIPVEIGLAAQINEWSAELNVSNPLG